MGDVFDAMNRANRERGPRPAGDSPAEARDASSEASEQGSLPEVEARPIAEEGDTYSPLSGPPFTEQLELEPHAPELQVKQDVVTAASKKARAEKVEHALEVAAGQAEGDRNVDPSLNGYSQDVVVHHDRGSIITEQYRAIRTQIVARARNRKVQSYLVTSSAPSEGKTVTSVNIAVAFSEFRDQKTILVEGDLRKPSFKNVFNRQSDHGLLQYLRGETDDLDAIVHKTVYDNLQFIPAGGHSSDQSTELLASPRMMALLDRLKDFYDHIFIDSPPVISVTDPCILGAMCDQTLLVVRLNKTPADAVDRAKRLLRAANCELSGVILTHLRNEMPKYFNRYTAYNYSYSR